MSLEVVSISRTGLQRVMMVLWQLLRLLVRVALSRCRRVVVALNRLWVLVMLRWGVMVTRTL